jgi:RNA polymerase primary sigma factor
MHAAELFDPDLGLKFSTYATHWIRQSIFRAVDNYGDTIRLPVHRVESIRKLRRAKRVVSLELGRQPTVRELADALDWTPEKVSYLQYLSSVRTASIETPVDVDHDSTLGDTIISPMLNPEQLYIQAELRSLLWSLLKTLSSRQRAILVRRFGLYDGREETLQRIADDFCVTRERIRQLEFRALNRIQPKARSMRVEQFL